MSAVPLDRLKKYMSEGEAKLVCALGRDNKSLDFVLEKAILTDPKKRNELLDQK